MLPEVIPDSKSKSSGDQYRSKNLLDYQLKIEKENTLREQIINELLIENEKIVDMVNAMHIFNNPVPKATNKTLDSYRKNSERKEKEGIKEEVLCIPELPKGKKMVIEILSTWGDKHYVGLNGIEIFGEDGRLVEVKKVKAVKS